MPMNPEHELRMIRVHTTSELLGFLTSVEQSAASLGKQLRTYDRLDEHAQESLALMVEAATRAGRAAGALAALDRITHLVPTEDDEADT